jgi:hypothetical protein
VSPAFSQTCASVSGDPLAGFTPLDPLTYLDLPERDVVSVTSPIETAITSQIIAGTARTASKTWCQIGIQQMVVDFEVPVEDDAIRAIITRAVYEWNAQGEPIGWQLDQCVFPARTAV